MGPQFIEVEVFARKAAKGKKIARTAREIVSEAVREENHIHHLAEPGEPVLLFGDRPDQVLDVAEATVEAERDTLGRKIRSDRPILLAGVASFPTAFDEMDEESRAAYEKWKGLTLDFLRAEYGEALMSVVEHTDEPRGHLHFYAVNLATVQNTRDLHPGHGAAKGKEGAESMAAYKDGCRQFQDRYFEAVSLKVGLTRSGPKRQKLTRQEWKEQKAGAEKIAKLHGEVEQKHSEAERHRAEARTLWDEAQAAWDEVEAAMTDAHAKAKALMKEAVRQGREKTREMLELLERKDRECDETLERVQQKYGLDRFEVAKLDARKDPKPSLLIEAAKASAAKNSAGGSAPRTPGF